ncbi:MAG TPA: TIGR01777 family oxidoreductase [Acidimicrobiales bacterium]|nr:TIGR01777 family oxidoreductase [Acidimicrobiales bacterium]
MDVVVSGSHGLIGSALVPALTAAGHRVRRLVRGSPGPGEVAWDPEAGTVDAGGLAGADAAVHLAGVGIGDKRWTTTQKQRIRDSRVKGTGTLARALAGLPTPPAVLVSGSAVGYYGDRGDEVLTEASGPGEGFLAEVVRDWEEAAAPAAEAGVRVVHTRTGIVQAAHGGALARQLPMFRLGVGGPLGPGRQWVSWVSLDDEVGAIVHALTTESLRGPVNLCAPEPTTSAGLAKAIGKALHRPALVPVPRFALSLVVGRQMTEEMVLASQRAVPEKLLASGYRFRHPDIAAAMHDLLHR